MAVVSRSTGPTMTEEAPARALRARPEGDSCDPDPVGLPLGDLWCPRGSSASGGLSPRRVADAPGDLKRAVFGGGAPRWGSWTRPRSQRATWTSWSPPCSPTCLASAASRSAPSVLCAWPTTITPRWAGRPTSRAPGAAPRRRDPAGRGRRRANASGDRGRAQQEGASHRALPLASGRTLAANTPSNAPISRSPDRRGSAAKARSSSR